MDIDRAEEIVKSLAEYGMRALTHRRSPFCPPPSTPASAPPIPLTFPKPLETIPVSYAGSGYSVPATTAVGSAACVPD
jgi:hypothetical protein